MTKIEWVRGSDGSEGLSWNALRAVLNVDGKIKSANHCEPINEACRHCYAERQNFRLGGLPFKPGHRKDYQFIVDQKKLTAPLLIKKPTRIFVESMSDAFGEWWPDDFIDQLYAVMAMTPQHTYINLTKRPERRRCYLSDSTMEICLRVAEVATGFQHQAGFTASDLWTLWPLPNVIEGVSVSCQKEADEFIPILLDTSAALRCVSAEPLLGPIDFTNINYNRFLELYDPKRFKQNANDPVIRYDVMRGHMKGPDDIGLPQLDWIIVGGESGPNARPMDPQWARDIRDQCQAAGVPFFFKQWGEWKAGDGDCVGQQYYRVGKKAAGRLLDGREHNDFPVSEQKELI